MGDLFSKEVTADAIAAIKNSTAITVVVKPGSSLNEVVGYDSEKKAWVIRVKAVAEKNKANIELLRFLRKETGKTWVIKSGSRSRNKILIATSSLLPSSQRTPQGQ